MDMILDVSNNWFFKHKKLVYKIAIRISNAEQAYILYDNLGNTKYVPFASIVWC